MVQLNGSELVLASHNQGKLREFQTAIAADPVTIISAGDLGLDEPVEDGATFEANALIKAEFVARASGRPAMADDSGLAVAALDGAPGIYSARWAGPEKDFSLAMGRVQTELESIGDKEHLAAFVCVLAVALPSGERVVASGRVNGYLVFPPRGEGGFGYDPIFCPEGETRTFAEMTGQEKSAYSHRMRALETLRPLIFE